MSPPSYGERFELHVADRIISVATRAVAGQEWLGESLAEAKRSIADAAFELVRDEVEQAWAEALSPAARDAALEEEAEHAVFEQAHADRVRGLTRAWFKAGWMRAQQALREAH